MELPQIIQSNLPILRSADQQINSIHNFNSPLPFDLTYSQVLGMRCRCSGRAIYCSAYYELLKLTAQLDLLLSLKTRHG